MRILEVEEYLRKVREENWNIGVQAWYDLTLFVTGDKKKAQKAQYDYLDRCEKAEIEARP